MDKTLKQDIIVMSFLYAIGAIQSLFFSNPGVIKSGILLILLAQSYYLIIMLLKMSNNYQSGISGPISWSIASVIVLLIASICTTIIYSNVDLNNEKLNKNKKYKTVLQASAGLQIVIAIFQYLSVMSILDTSFQFNTQSLNNNNIKKASIGFSYIVLAFLIWMTNEIKKLKRYTIPSD